jgi:hypothetical protein
MFLDRYEVEINPDQTVYEFISEGPKGKIKKVVRYSSTNLKDFYNLGFGDMNLETKMLDDKIVTDNGDSEKVLATVAATLYAFTYKNPDAWIFAQGSSPARTRLYQMGISKNWTEIKDDFKVRGLYKKVWKDFKINQNYDAFIVKRKQID